jgi:menaquinone-dependent protoporphyrinogen oxidase
MIGEALRAHGVPARVRPTGEVQSLDGYDAVIVGGAIYNGRWHRAARRFVRRHRQELRSLPVWLFSSGPVGDRWQSPHTPPVRQVRRLIDAVAARGHRTFGGRPVADPPGRVGYLLPAPWAGDWRDQGEVERWASAIAAELTSTAGRPAPSPA